MRVLHINGGNIFGGIETLLVTLAKHQKLCDGVEFGFALCFEGRLSEELRPSGACVEMLGPVRLSRPWTLWSARRRLAEILVQGRWDAVITHGCWPHIVSAPVVRRAKRPLVFWAHGIGNNRSWFEWFASRWPPDFIFANSHATRKPLVANLFPNTPVEVVYYPVSPPELPDRAAVRREVRSSLEAGDDLVAIITVSRIEGWKGHVVLIEALGLLKDVPNWVWWVVGGAQRPAEESLLSRLRRRVDELGLSARVRFLGQRNDVSRLLAGADVFCQSNTFPEPFGIVFVEALYAGLPVVTSAMGGALEIVDDSCGMLVPESSPESLATALRQLTSNADLRRRLAAAGPRRAASLCDPPAQLSRLKELLERVSPEVAKAP